MASLARVYRRYRWRLSLKQFMRLMEQPYWRLRDSLRTGGGTSATGSRPVTSGLCGGGGGRRGADLRLSSGLPGPPATEDTHWAREVDPNRLYEVKTELDKSGIYLQEETDEFSRIFFAPKRRQSPADHKNMNALLDQAVTCFAQLQHDEEEEAELWRGKTWAFRNLYSFLSQVIPYQDSDLEKLFTYLRHLVLKLPKRKSGPRYQLDEEVELDYYRLQKISEGSISLAEGYAKPLDGPCEVGSGMVREDPIALSRLMDLINERFGSELSEADQLFFDQIAEAASQNETLRKAAEVNSLDKFQLVFRQVLESLFIERMELNEELFADYMSKPEMQELVSQWLGGQVYDRLGSSKASMDSS